MTMTDGAPCPRCAATRTWGLPYMGEYPPVYWCVACQRTFRPESLAGVTDRQGGYVADRGQGAPGRQGRLF